MRCKYYLCKFSKFCSNTENHTRCHISIQSFCLQNFFALQASSYTFCSNNFMLCFIPNGTVYESVVQYIRLQMLRVSEK